MSIEEKRTIISAANWLVKLLLDCEDPEFVDMVLSNVMGGCYIDYEEET